MWRNLCTVKMVFDLLTSKGLPLQTAGRERIAAIFAKELGILFY